MLRVEGPQTLERHHRAFYVDLTVRIFGDPGVFEALFRRKPPFGIVGQHSFHQIDGIFMDVL
jgi:hypothetical protein